MLRKSMPNKETAEWKLADAKNRFSELVNLALSKGPQFVRRRNETVVVIAAAELDKLRGKTCSFKEYLVKGDSLEGDSLALEGLDLQRDRSVGRKIKL